MWQTLVDLNLRDLFLPDVSLLEIVVRGTLIYLGLFVLRREAGTVGIADLLMIVLIADAAQNGMAAEYHSLTAGLYWSPLLSFGIT